MKWFKHISDSLDDPFIFDLVDKFRGDGYLVFFGTLEVYSREFKADHGWALEIQTSFLMRKLVNISKKKLKNILCFLDESGKWNVSFSDDDKYITIFIPKFIEILDQHTLKILKNQDYDYNGGTEKWEKTKRKIRKRDNFCCKICGKTTEENKRSLQVHHIKHFKLFKNVDDANNPLNLISLCNSCHNRARTGIFDDKFKEIQNGIQNGSGKIHTNGIHLPEVEVEVEVDKETTIPDLKKSGEEKSYTTKNNKKLTGKRLETFETFWNAFNYKHGKAEAAEAWYKLPPLTDKVVEKIISAAKIEAKRRPEIIAKGNTPKWAQGWITSRRWEDEGYFEKTNSPRPNQPSLKEQIS